MFRDLDQMGSDVVWLVAIGVCWPMTMTVAISVSAVSVMGFGLALEL